MSAAAARPRVGGAFAVSAALHAVALGALAATRAPVPRPAPPVYRVDLVAAPPGPAQLGEPAPGAVGAVPNASPSVAPNAALGAALAAPPAPAPANRPAFAPVRPPSPPPTPAAPSRAAPTVRPTPPRPAASTAAPSHAPPLKAAPPKAAPPRPTPVRPAPPPRVAAATPSKPSVPHAPPAAPSPAAAATAKAPRTAAAPGKAPGPPATVPAGAGGPPTPRPIASAPVGGTGRDPTTVRTPGLNFPYPGYLANIARQVDLRFDPGARRLEADVAFLIHRDGSATDIHVVRSSGSYAFDLEAQGAVEAAGAARAFGALPGGFRDDVLPVTFSFDPRGLR